MTCSATPGPRTAADLQAFQTELEALRTQVMSSLGSADARYVKTLLWIARGLDVSGRGLLLLGGWFWPTWLLGVCLLTLGHLVETMELGHNLMHGQFNWMNDPRFSAHGYRWNLACEPANWREFHNHIHHHYSNVKGRDRDYSGVRLFGEQAWKPSHLLQCLHVVTSSMSFEWGAAIHNLHLERRRVDPVGAQARIDQLWPRTRAHILFTLRREYLWWPLLGMLASALAAFMSGDPVLSSAMSGGLAVLAGHLAAGVCRNVWAYFVIACGHFTAEAHIFHEADLVGESKGQWYLRQILSAANIEGGIVLDVLSGNATHQIEHHIFPDMPSNRLAEIAPAVHAICLRYGVPYNTGSLSRQVLTVVLRIVRHSFPGGWHNLTRLNPSTADQGCGESVT
jgi:fatty acid desaturase